MARKPMITRTIKATNVCVLCLDTESAEPINMDFTLPRTYESEEAIISAVRSLVNMPNIVPAKVVRKEVTETLYGMLESDFIKYASPMNAKN